MCCHNQTELFVLKFWAITVTTAADTSHSAIIFPLPASYAPQVAGATEKVVIKWVASLVRFVGQLHVTILTMVAVNMKILVHRNDSHSLFRTLNWSDRLTTGCALRCKQSMIVVNAVNITVDVDCEWFSIEAKTTDATPKTARMI
jgi:hypothetical protein